MHARLHPSLSALNHLESVFTSREGAEDQGPRYKMLLFASPKTHPLSTWGVYLRVTIIWESAYTPAGIPEPLFSPWVRNSIRSVFFFFGLNSSLTMFDVLRFAPAPAITRNSITPGGTYRSSKTACFLAAPRSK